MSKVILVNGQNVELSADAQTSGTGYMKVPDLAGGTKFHVPAASAAHAAELAKLGLHGADIASASTANLEAATGELVDVTGTTTITAITLSEGHRRIVRFTGVLTLTHGASLVLPGAANIVTAAGDVAVFEGYASGVVRCAGYMRAAGAPWNGAVLTSQLSDMQYGAITANQAWANSETYANMSFTLATGGTAAGPTLAANTKYHVRASITFGDGTGKTPKFTIALSGSTIRGGKISYITDAYFNSNDFVLDPITAASNVEVVFTQGSDNDGNVIWDFIIDAGATGGVLAFRFAKSAAGSAAGNVTAAFFECRKI